MKIRPKNLELEAIYYPGDDLWLVGGRIEKLFGGSVVRTETTEMEDGEVQMVHDTICVDLWGKTYRATVGDWLVFDPLHKSVRVMTNETFHKYYEKED